MVCWSTAAKSGRVLATYSISQFDTERQGTCTTSYTTSCNTVQLIMGQLGMEPLRKSCSVSLVPEHVRVWSRSSHGMQPAKESAARTLQPEDCMQLRAQKLASILS